MPAGCHDGPRSATSPRKVTNSRLRLQNRSFGNLALESQVPSMTTESLFDRYWSAQQHNLIRGSANAQICKTVLARRRRTDPRVQTRCPRSRHWLSILDVRAAFAAFAEISSSRERRLRCNTAQRERVVDAENVISNLGRQMPAIRLALDHIAPLSRAYLACPESAFQDPRARPGPSLVVAGTFSVEANAVYAFDRQLCLLVFSCSMTSARDTVLWPLVQ
ncbi:hypothetical protein PHSY_002055 [Pseudozyma hubeiensis SY62]|uniref:Uncharacterized protein n=1 Tax=Pseudozyma hubeiensis (strain SY62) TaxID=1305764 RepID=R9NZY5_PSEHS|nr:hypothetical protein PHSY_002055 [Pseudozyma hubeiensis SY62]GAC94483.1 hypothetical protein PHSY_002055 [Pseudozyma hubeiensis SY62]